MDQFCHTITTDGLLNSMDSYFYFISVYCEEPDKNYESNNVIRRKILKCPKYPSKLISDCIIINLYNEENIAGWINGKGSFHLNDKLLITNSIGQVITGIADSLDLSSACSIL